MGENTMRLALVVFPLQFADKQFCLTGFSEHEDRGLLDRPLKMVIADLLIGSPGPFAVGFLVWPNQAGV